MYDSEAEIAQAKRDCVALAEEVLTALTDRPVVEEEEDGAAADA